MKKVYSLVLMALFANSIMLAQNITGFEADKIVPGTNVIRMNADSKVPTYFEFRKDAEIEFVNFDSWMHETFGLSSTIGFKLLNVEKDNLGMQHFRYQKPLTAWLWKEPCLSSIPKMVGLSLSALPSSSNWAA